MMRVDNDLDKGARRLPRIDILSEFVRSFRALKMSFNSLRRFGWVRRGEKADKRHRRGITSDQCRVGGETYYIWNWLAV